MPKQEIESNALEDGAVFQMIMICCLIPRAKPSAPKENKLVSQLCGKEIELKTLHRFKSIT